MAYRVQRSWGAQRIVVRTDEGAGEQNPPGEYSPFEPDEGWDKVVFQ